MKPLLRSWLCDGALRTAWAFPEVDVLFIRILCVRGNFPCDNLFVSGESLDFAVTLLF
jgi:hypothetical protein